MSAAAFEIRTPLLSKAASAAESVLDGIIRDEKVAKTMLNAANTVTRTVGQELRVRLAAPRLADIDAKFAK